MFTPHKRNRFAPVSLSGEHPVTQFKVYFSFTDAFFFKEVYHCGNRFINAFSCNKSGIYHCACIGICVCFFLHIFPTGNNFNNRKTEFRCKLVVTGIMCRNRHNCTCSVCSKYIVGNKYRNFCIVNRVYRHNAGKLNACFIFSKLCTFKLCLFSSFSHICFNFIIVFNFIFQLADKFMFRRKNNICCAEKCITSCCVYCYYIIVAVNFEINFRTFGSADPVFLLCFNFINIICLVKVINKLLSIFSYFKHPLALIFLNNFSAATFTNAANNLFVCKTNFTACAPVDRHFLFICKTFFKQLKENPLCPFIVVRVGCVYFSCPVK